MIWLLKIWKIGKKRTQLDKAFEIAYNPKYDCYQRGLNSIIEKCFDKKSSGSGVVLNH